MWTKNLSSPTFKKVIEMFKESIGVMLLFISTINGYDLHPVHVSMAQDVKSCDALDRLIAYTSNSANGLDIWTVKPSDLVTINLTNGNSYNLNPSWSPDGSKLAFETTRDGNWEIYLMDTNGTNLINLSNDPSDDEYPKWSPDGSKIAFISNRGGNQDIYAMNSDGTDVVNISNDSGDSIMPVWAPNSESIAYLSGDKDLRKIVINDLKQGTTISYPNASHLNFMSWSPNGDFITFSSEMDGNSEIYILDIERRLIARLTTTPDTNYQPYWSPSGNLIVYWSINKDVLGTSVRVISADGSIDRKLAPNSLVDTGGIWSPDGKYIAFYSAQDTTSLYIMDIDGSSPRQLVSRIQDSSLAWQPCLTTY